MVFSYLGLGAYSIYLFHVPLLSNLAPFFLHKRLLKMVAIILVLMVATVTWHFVELPLTEFGRRRFRYRSREIPASEKLIAPALTH
jgi:peptidoglycan/LPS O-acetylase OafA/YrhL